MLAAEQYDRRDAAQKTAVERHSPLPQFKDLGRMLNEESQIVEQHVTGAASEDDAQCDPEDKIVDLRQRDRRWSAP